MYLLLDHGWAGLSGVLLGQLGGNTHLLLDLLLMRMWMLVLVLLLLVMLTFLGICRLLHVLQPELREVNLSRVSTRVALAW